MMEIVNGRNVVVVVSHGCGRVLLGHLLVENFVRSLQSSTSLRKKNVREGRKIALWQILLPYSYYANNYYINQLTTDLSEFHSQGREQKLGRHLGKYKSMESMWSWAGVFLWFLTLKKSTFSLTILNENPVNSFTVKWVLRQKILFSALMLSYQEW